MLSKIQYFLDYIYDPSWTTFSIIFTSYFLTFVESQAKILTRFAWRKALESFLQHNHYLAKVSSGYSFLSPWSQRWEQRLHLVGSLLAFLHLALCILTWIFLPRDFLSGKGILCLVTHYSLFCVWIFCLNAKQTLREWRSELLPSESGPYKDTPSLVLYPPQTVFILQKVWTETIQDIRLSDFS